MQDRWSFSAGRTADIRALLAKLFSAREEALCAILGKPIHIDELYQIYGVCE